ncbi:hypothetical protein GTY40_25790 [Streptomyces sp. SID8359]|uniref:hypothetical protein n=1 Tax=unclassified Streptomyces TaxID=2593676 RepID=UPI00048A7E6A|nr:MULTISPECIES: hypothetical protein [unclassified Streptomyces]MYT94434.1 hypothetical protein [Streptomyces sp. SID8359]
MLRYWLAIVRRTAVAAVSVAVVIGAAMAGVLISEDTHAWPTALLQGMLAGLLAGVVLAVVIATSNTWHLWRTASRHGLTPAAEAAAVSCTVVFRTPVPAGTTAYQLTDSVLHALKKVPSPRIDEVEEFTHGKLTLICASSPVGPVRLRISIETDRDTATVTMDARPVTPWKRLDGGASWSVLTVFEPHVRKAVHREAGGS